MDDHTHDTRLQVGAAEARQIIGGISARKVWQMTKDGAIPHNKIGTRTLYPVAGLRAWVEAGCPTEPGSAASLKWTGGAS